MRSMHKALIVIFSLSLVSINLAYPNRLPVAVSRWRNDEIKSDLDWLMASGTDFHSMPDRIGARLFRGYIGSMDAAAAKKTGIDQITFHEVESMSLWILLSPIPLLIHPPNPGLQKMVFMSLFPLENLILFAIYFFPFLLSVSSQDEVIYAECPPAGRPKTLFADTGTYKLFMTPGFYRGVYTPNMDCHWIIRSPGPEAWIQLLIHYSHMEDRLFTECDDFAEIRDGPTSQSPLLLKWCGYFNPSAFSSVNDALYLRFKSDQFFEDGRGLNISYVAYSRPGCPPGWKESMSTGNCYHLVSPQPPFPKMSWLDAQKRCSYERGNLLTVTNDEERTQVFNFYGSSTEQPWIGVNDAQEEGRFVSVDPNAKLFPDPFRPSGGGGNRRCVYMDLMHGGAAMYTADDCRSERSYVCQRRIDGTTVPYPPPEAIIKNSLIAGAAVTWSPAYLWLIVLVVLILLLLACAPWIRKRYKEYKSNQIAAQSETDSRNVLIRNNAVMAANPDLNTVHATGASGQHLPPPANVILAYDNIHLAQPEKKPLESAGVQTTPAMAESSAADPNALTYRKLTAGNGHLYPNNEQPNGFLADNAMTRSAGRSKHALPMAPVEKFDRPVIRPLDNVSAISLDEFWHKIEVERIRKIDVRQSPPAEHL